MKSRKQNLDLVGRVFGELTVTEKLPYKKGNDHHTLYSCRCSCGKIVAVSSWNLLHGHVKSCGHLLSDIAASKLKKIFNQNDLGRGDGTMCAMLVGTNPYQSGTSGYRGVSWSKKAHAYTAQITFRRKKYHLGVFSDPAEAHKAYLEAKEKLHNQFLADYGYAKRKEED